MDEFDAVLKARRLSGQISADQVPPPLEVYAKTVGDVLIRYDTSLSDDEAGHTLPMGGRHCIIVNGNDRPERQRFTACHEIAHIVLGLRTEHSGAGVHFARSPNEVLCDVFAAELLLPCHLFKPRVESSDICFDAIKSLGADFVASHTATGSRFAAVCDRPCAFILARDGVIQYSSCSPSLRDGRGWIRPKVKVPHGSLAAQLIGGARSNGPEEIAADLWLEDWRRGGVLLEEARHYPRWGLTLSLVWFEDGCLPTSSAYADDDDDEEAALQPLDGNLPWPGKNRRRR